MYDRKIFRKHIKFLRINYVVGGTVPVLEERKGLIDIDTLDYEETYYDDWSRHR